MAELIFHYSSMNAQKSARLMMTAFGFEKQNKSFQILKSAKDNNPTKIRSRALQIEMDCFPISHFTDILQVVIIHKPKYLFIDEVQFMDTEMIDTLAILVNEWDINIIAYGLLTDFRGKLFEGSKRLIEQADTLKEIDNTCIYCEGKAIRNMRIVEGEPVFDGEIIVPGDSYESVCRKCYEGFKKKAKEKVTHGHS